MHGLSVTSPPHWVQPFRLSDVKALEAAKVNDPPGTPPLGDITNPTRLREGMSMVTTVELPRLAAWSMSVKLGRLKTVGPTGVSVNDPAVRRVALLESPWLSLA